MNLGGKKRCQKDQQAKYQQTKTKEKSKRGLKKKKRPREKVRIRRVTYPQNGRQTHGNLTIITGDAKKKTRARKATRKLLKGLPES